MKKDKKKYFISVMDSDGCERKHIKLTKQQIEWMIILLEASKDVIDCESFRNKLRKILSND